ncbi:acyl-CoA N-acyltransferase [Aspergillus campestris IBT 28561]|uniref:Acyl-CoA N-acyltransferase n=1 Tax=Aspergillus campestris (strain IBT 28561) TaxID=1392248 RepID=A0A2I1CUX5_ASPC2|nr:acyl-CoA N-acyltransferase [Aspergillus campestris IBT 28561]PKY01436.1 acyl-CoA N-acyltransferase [Aspergillus campestris IBT 28561]
MSDQTNQQSSGTVNGPGLPPELADELDDDDDEEEVDEDYVAVDHDDINEFPYWFRRPPVHHRTQLDELHPFTQVLTVSHVDDCVEVEQAFPEAERCTRDKFTYRLNRCPELCLGLFTLPILGDGEAKPRPTLVGHVVASRTPTVLVTDKAMQLPENWRTERFSIKDGETVGHDEYGSTIAIHSLAVRPEHQGKQVARTLMKAYIQRIKEAQIAQRISIISHDHLVNFYESFGFENRGPSKCQFGGGGWVDLVLEFTNE